MRLTCLVAAISLIALQLSFKSEIESQSKGQVEAIFQFAYWASLILVSVAGILSYLRLKNSDMDIKVVTNNDSTTETSLSESIEVQTSTTPNMTKITTDNHLLSPQNLKIIALIASGMILLGFILPWFDFKNSDSDFSRVNDGVKWIKLLWEEKASNGNSAELFTKLFGVCILPVLAGVLIWNRLINGNKKVKLT